MIQEKVLISLLAFYYFYIVVYGLFMFRRRVAAVKGGHVKPGYFKTYQLDAPPEVKVLGNHYDNQFQVPVIFMITSLTALVTHSVNGLLVALAFLFVVSRLIHSYIHLTSNKIYRRAGTFFMGMIMIAIMWLTILTQIWLN